MKGNHFTWVATTLKLVEIARFGKMTRIFYLTDCSPNLTAVITNIRHLPPNLWALHPALFRRSSFNNVLHSCDKDVNLKNLSTFCPYCTIIR